jgi:two-component system nitrate/nitrite response regulator NarL
MVVQTLMPTAHPDARMSGVAAWSVLIVDDHAGFRSMARALLEADGFDVAGEAADGAAAIVAAATLRPDLVLLDIHLPDLDGFAVCARIAARDHPPRVVLTSSRAASVYRRRLATSSALGFIAKDELTAAGLLALLDAR